MRPTILALVLFAVCVPCALAAGSYGASADTPSVTEGQGPLIFTVFRVNSQHAENLTYTATIAQGGYAPLQGPLAFAAGEGEKKVFVEFPEDDVWKREWMTAVLSIRNVFGQEVASASALIYDDDPPVRYELARYPAAVYENGGTYEIDVTRTGDLSRASEAVVQLRRKDGAQGIDFGQYVPFAAGETQKTLQFYVTNDTYYSGPPVEYWLTAYNQYYFPTDTSELTIIDDEPAPRLIMPRVEIHETDEPIYDVAITLQLDVPYLNGLTAHLTALPGSAGEHDFALGHPAVTWNPKDYTATYLIRIKGDNVAEGDESFELRIGNLGVVAVDIIDDDRPPFELAFEASEYHFTEAEAGTVRILRTGALDAGTATLLFLPQTAVEWPEPVEIAFAAGEASKLVALDFADAWYTGNRLAKLALEWGGYRGATADVTVTDDEARPTLSIADASVQEGGPGESRELEFTLTLSAPVGATLAVGVATQPGTAQADDFTQLVSAATFTPGALTARAAVTVRGDDAQEPDETLGMRITSCCGGLADVARESATGIIRNDDGGSSTAFRIEGASRFEERHEWLEIAVVRTDTSGTATATVKLHAGQARSFPPVNVFFRAGEARKSVRYAINDRVYSGDADATLEVFAGARRDETRAVKIVEDESRPAIEIHNTTISTAEGRPAPAKTAKFLITVTPPAWTAMEVHVTTIAGAGATPGLDFESVDRIVTIPAGAGRVEVPVTVRPYWSANETEKAFRMRMTYFAPPTVPATIAAGEARCDITLEKGATASLATYERGVPAGAKRAITVLLPVASFAVETLTVTSSAPDVVSVPATVQTAPGAREVTFEATALAPGEASIAIALPLFYGSPSLTAPLTVFAIHVPVATPQRLVLRSGETARVSLTSLPVSTDVIRATIEVADKSIVFTHADAQIHPGITGSFDVYGANAGKTEIIVRFPAEAGATELRIPVEVTDASKKQRGVRH